MAWLGDAIFEQRVRLRVAARGDYPTDRLDAVKAELVRAEAQAELLDALSERLDESEQSVVRRARNANVPNRSRGQRDTKAYRSATALEALVAHWWLEGDCGQRKLDELLDPQLEARIDEAIARRVKRIRRG